MGSLCFKGEEANSPPPGEGGTRRVMFERFDRDRKGYISIDDLIRMMRDDKMYFQGKDAHYIMEKYGTDGKMTFANFELWWGSTYTTYSDDNNLKPILDEIEKENQEHMHTILEMPENHPPRNTHVVISRS